MRAFRAILAVFCALLFGVCPSGCLIAAAFPEAVDACCESERAPDDSGSGQPCGVDSCAPCVTLRTGVNLSAISIPVLPAPLWTESQELAEMMARLMAAAEEDVRTTGLDPTAIPPPPWSDVMKRAVPVRGPSVLS
jgi:hypothetical protein